MCLKKEEGQIEALKSGSKYLERNMPIWGEKLSVKTSPIIYDNETKEKIGVFNFSFGQQSQQRALQ